MISDAAVAFDGEDSLQPEKPAHDLGQLGKVLDFKDEIGMDQGVLGFHVHSNHVRVQGGQEFRHVLQEILSRLGEHAKLNHERVGLRKIKAVLNSKLSLIGLLPTMVEPTPFQKANFLQVVQQYHPLMIRIGDGPGAFASIPRRSCIAEAQAEGVVLWEMKKTAARDAWREIEPSLNRIGDIVTAATPATVTREASHAAAT